MPSFIRYSIINENQEQLKKVSHILSKLSNIYLTINNKNSSIISSTTKEYKKHFEEMIYKLKNNGYLIGWTSRLYIALFIFILIYGIYLFILRENKKGWPCSNKTENDLLISEKERPMLPKEDGKQKSVQELSNLAKKVDENKSEKSEPKSPEKDSENKSEKKDQNSNEKEGENKSDKKDPKSPEKDSENKSDKKDQL